MAFIGDFTNIISSGTAVFSNSNGISFGMSNSSVITANLPSLKLFEFFWGAVDPIPVVISSGAKNLTFMKVSIPFQISATRMDLLGSLSIPASTNGSYTLSVGVYTFNVSTASSVSSSSTSVTFANSGTRNSNSTMYGGQHGWRLRSCPLGTMNFTPGEYLVGVMLSMSNPAGTTGSFSFAGMPWDGNTNTLQTIRAPGGGDYTQYWANGLFSAATGAFPSSLHISAINQTHTETFGPLYFRLVGTL